MDTGESHATTVYNKEYQMCLILELSSTMESKDASLCIISMSMFLEEDSSPGHLDKVKISI